MHSWLAGTAFVRQRNKDSKTIGADSAWPWLSFAREHEGEILLWVLVELRGQDALSECNSVDVVRLWHDLAL